MKQMIHYITVIIIVTLGLTMVTSRIFSEEECTSDCENGNCIFDGLSNTPTGNTNLAINDDCQLEILGVGSSGQDGVVQSGLNSTLMSTSLATPNFSASITGSTAIITQLGVVGGKTDKVISVLNIVNFNDDDIKVIFDCQTIGVDGYTVEIFTGLVLLEKQDTGPDPATLFYPKEDIQSITCGIEPNGDVFTAIRLGGKVPISVGTQLSETGPFTGDLVIVTGFSPDIIPTIQTDIENIFMDTGNITLSSLFAGDLQSRCTSNADDQDNGIRPCNFDNPGEESLVSPTADIIPLTRNVTLDEYAVTFATLINPNLEEGAVLNGCGIAPMDFTFANEFSFQATNLLTNDLIGLPNTPVDIEPGGMQTFAIALHATEQVSPVDLELIYGCANSGKAETLPGINTFTFSASVNKTSDLIAVSTTVNDEGILTIPINESTIFSVAVTNIGEGGVITVTADTGDTNLPLDITICKTDPDTGVCVTIPGNSVTSQIDADKVTTFGVFVISNGEIPFDPDINRIFVRLKDTSGMIRGITSVTVQTQ